MSGDVLAIAGLLRREGILAVLADCDEFDVVGLPPNDPELTSKVAKATPEIAIIDVAGAHANAAGALALELARVRPRIGVIVLTDNADPEFARAFLEEGIASRGYIAYDELHTVDDFVTAVRAVASGQSAIDAPIVDLILREGEGLVSRLTPRESEVLAEVATGKNNAAIADTFTISKRAVERHLNSIFFKLDLTHSANLSPRVAASLLYLRAETAREAAVVVGAEARAVSAEARQRRRRSKEPTD